MWELCDTKMDWTDLIPDITADKVGHFLIGEEMKSLYMTSSQKIIPEGLVGGQEDDAARVVLMNLVGRNVVSGLWILLETTTLYRRRLQKTLSKWKRVCFQSKPCIPTSRQFTTTTWSPQSVSGCQIGLCLPARWRATLSPSLKAS